MFAITMKEIRVMLRSRKACWFLLLTLLTVGGFFLIPWANVSRSMDSIGARARVGREVFMFLSMVQLCAMGLIAPLMTASTVTIERENNTMDLLICTGLSRVKMLLGKWAATLFYELMLVICILPILSLVFQLGGIGLDEYIFIALMIALTVLTYGMVGLACSCIFRKSVTALFATLLTILFLSGGIPLFFVLLDDWHFLNINGLDPTSGSTSQPVLYTLFWSISPVMTWLRHIIQLENSGRSALANTPISAAHLDFYLIGHLVFQAFLFLTSLKLAHRAILRREVNKTTMPTEQIDDPAELTRRRHHWPFYLIDPLRRPQVIADGRNPIFIKEQRVGALARPRTLFWITLLCIPLSLFLFESAHDIYSLNFIFYAVGFGCTLIMLFVPIFAATLISREREEKTIDLLATTTLTSNQVVRAKFFVALRFCSVIALGITMLPLLLRLARSADWFSGSMAWDTMLDRIFWDCGVTAGIIFTLIASFSAIYTAVCIFISSSQRRNVSAVIISYIMMGLLCAMPLIGLLFFELESFNWSLANILKQPLELIFHGIVPLFSHVYYLVMDSPSNARHLYIFWQDNHFKSSWSDAVLVLLHALLVTGLTGLLLNLAARRLRKEMA